MLRSGVDRYMLNKNVFKSLNLFLSLILFFDFSLIPFSAQANQDNEEKIVFFPFDQELSENFINAIIAQNQERYPAEKKQLTLEVKKIVAPTQYHVITAYNSDPRQTDSTPCITANGFDVCKHGIEDTVAANFLKFNTKIKMPDLFGDRIFIVRDRMHPRFNNRVDVWMKDYDQAIIFGKKLTRIELVN